MLKAFFDWNLTLRPLVWILVVNIASISASLKKYTESSKSKPEMLIDELTPYSNTAEQISTGRKTTILMKKRGTDGSYIYY